MINSPLQHIFDLASTNVPLQHIFDVSAKVDVLDDSPATFLYTLWLDSNMRLGLRTILLEALSTSLTVILPFHIAWYIPFAFTLIDPKVFTAESIIFGMGAGYLVIFLCVFTGVAAPLMFIFYLKPIFYVCALGFFLWSTIATVENTNPLFSERDLLYRYIRYRQNRIIEFSKVQRVQDVLVKRQRMKSEREQEQPLTFDQYTQLIDEKISRIKLSPSQRRTLMGATSLEEGLRTLSEKVRTPLSFKEFSGNKRLNANEKDWWTWSVEPIYDRTTATLRERPRRTPAPVMGIVARVPDWFRSFYFPLGMGLTFADCPGFFARPLYIFSAGDWRSCTIFLLLFFGICPVYLWVYKKWKAGLGAPLPYKLSFDPEGLERFLADSLDNLRYMEEDKFKVQSTNPDQFFDEFMPTQQARFDMLEGETRIQTAQRDIWRYRFQPFPMGLLTVIFSFVLLESTTAAAVIIPYRTMPLTLLPPWAKEHVYKTQPLWESPERRLRNHLITDKESPAGEAGWAPSKTRSSMLKKRPRRGDKHIAFEPTYREFYNRRLMSRQFATKFSAHNWYRIKGKERVDPNVTLVERPYINSIKDPFKLNLQDKRQLKTTVEALDYLPMQWSSVALPSQLINLEDPYNFAKGGQTTVSQRYFVPSDKLAILDETKVRKVTVPTFVSTSLERLFSPELRTRCTAVFVRITEPIRKKYNEEVKKWTKKERQKDQKDPQQKGQEQRKTIGFPTSLFTQKKMETTTSQARKSKLAKDRRWFEKLPTDYETLNGNVTFFHGGESQSVTTRLRFRRIYNNSIFYGTHYQFPPEGDHPGLENDRDKKVKKGQEKRIAKNLRVKRGEMPFELDDPYYYYRYRDTEMKKRQDGFNAMVFEKVPSQYQLPRWITIDSTHAWKTFLSSVHRTSPTLKIRGQALFGFKENSDLESISKREVQELQTTYYQPESTSTSPSETESDSLFESDSDTSLKKRLHTLSTTVYDTFQTFDDELSFDDKAEIEDELFLEDYVDIEDELFLEDYVDIEDEVNSENDRSVEDKFDSKHIQQSRPKRKKKNVFSDWLMNTPIPPFSDNSIDGLSALPKGHLPPSSRQLWMGRANTKVPFESGADLGNKRETTTNGTDEGDDLRDDLGSDTDEADDGNNEDTLEFFDVGPDEANNEDTLEFFDVGPDEANNGDTLEFFDVGPDEANNGDTLEFFDIGPDEANNEDNLESSTDDAEGSKTEEDLLYHYWKVEQPSLEQPSLEQPSLEQPSFEPPSLEQPSQHSSQKRFITFFETKMSSIERSAGDTVGSWVTNVVDYFRPTSLDTKTPNKLSELTTFTPDEPLEDFLAHNPQLVQYILNKPNLSDRDFFTVFTQLGIKDPSKYIQLLHTDNTYNYLWNWSHVPSESLFMMAEQLSNNDLLTYYSANATRENFYSLDVPLRHEQRTKKLTNEKKKNKRDKDAKENTNDQKTKLAKEGKKDKKNKKDTKTKLAREDKNEKKKDKKDKRAKEEKKDKKNQKDTKTKLAREDKNEKKKDKKDKRAKEEKKDKRNQKDTKTKLAREDKNEKKKDKKEKRDRKAFKAFQKLTNKGKKTKEKRDGKAFHETESTELVEETQEDQKTKLAKEEKKDKKNKKDTKTKLVREDKKDKKNKKDKKIKLTKKDKIDIDYLSWKTNFSAGGRPYSFFSKRDDHVVKIYVFEGDDKKAGDKEAKDKTQEEIEAEEAARKKKEDEEEEAAIQAYASLAQKVKESARGKKTDPDTIVPKSLRELGIDNMRTILDGSCLPKPGGDYGEYLDLPIPTSTWSEVFTVDAWNGLLNSRTLKWRNAELSRSKETDLTALNNYKSSGEFASEQESQQAQATCIRNTIRSAYLEKVGKENVVPTVPDALLDVYSAGIKTQETDSALDNEILTVTYNLERALDHNLHPTKLYEDPFFQVMQPKKTYSLAVEDPYTLNPFEVDFKHTHAHVEMEGLHKMLKQEREEADFDELTIEEEMYLEAKQVHLVQQGEEMVLKEKTNERAKKDKKNKANIEKKTKLAKEENKDKKNKKDTKTKLAREDKKEKKKDKKDKRAKEHTNDQKTKLTKQDKKNKKDKTDKAIKADKKDKKTELVKENEKDKTDKDTKTDKKDKTNKAIKADKKTKLTKQDKKDKKDKATKKEKKEKRDRKAFKKFQKIIKNEKKEKRDRKAFKQTDRKDPTNNTQNKKKQRSTLYHRPIFSSLANKMVKDDKTLSVERKKADKKNKKDKKKKLTKQDKKDKKIKLVKENKKDKKDKKDKAIKEDKKDTTNKKDESSPVKGVKVYTRDEAIEAGIIKEPTKEDQQQKQEKWPNDKATRASDGAYYRFYTHLRMDKIYVEKNILDVKSSVGKVWKFMAKGKPKEYRSEKHFAKYIDHLENLSKELGISRMERSQMIYPLTAEHWEELSELDTLRFLPRLEDKREELMYPLSRGTLSFSIDDGEDDDEPKDLRFFKDSFDDKLEWTHLLGEKSTEEAEKEWRKIRDIHIGDRKRESNREVNPFEVDLQHTHDYFGYETDTDSEELTEEEKKAEKTEEEYSQYLSLLDNTTTIDDEDERERLRQIYEQRLFDEEKLLYKQYHRKDGAENETENDLKNNFEGGLEDDAENEMGANLEEKRSIEKDQKDDEESEREDDRYESEREDEQYESDTEDEDAKELEDSRLFYVSEEVRGEFLPHWPWRTRNKLSLESREKRDEKNAERRSQHHKYSKHIRPPFDPAYTVDDERIDRNGSELYEDPHWFVRPMRERNIEEDDIRFNTPIEELEEEPASVIQRSMAQNILHKFKMLKKGLGSLVNKIKGLFKQEDVSDEVEKSPFNLMYKRYVLWVQEFEPPDGWYVYTSHTDRNQMFRNLKGSPNLRVRDSRTEQSIAGFERALFRPISDTPRLSNTFDPKETTGPFSETTDFLRPVHWFDHPEYGNTAEEPILDEETYEKLFALYAELSAFNIVPK